MILTLILESLVNIEGDGGRYLDELPKVHWSKTYHVLMLVLSPSLVRKKVHDSLRDARRNIGNRSHFMREELDYIVDDIVTGGTMLKQKVY